MQYRTTQDPIFALIADYKAAEKAVRAASRAQEDLENRLDAEDDAKHPHIPHPARIRLRRSHTPYVSISGPGWGMFASCKSDITDGLDRKYGDMLGMGPDAKKALIAAKEVERAELTSKLAELRKARAKGWRTSGLTKAKAYYEKCDKAASIATRQMCRTKPTTIAGLAALLDVLHEKTKDGLGWDYFDNRSADIYKTVAAAAHALAGETDTRKSANIRLVAAR